MESGPGESGIVPDLYTRWCGMENISRVTVERERIWALLDTGCQVNTLTPRFVETHNLEVRPITDLIEGDGPKVIGVGGTAVHPLGYVIVNIRLEGAGNYNEDSIVLVIPDASVFAARTPMIIGTCTLNHIVEAMKESELDDLSLSWELIRHSQELIGQAGRISWRTSGVTCKSGTIEGADEIFYAYDGQPHGTICHLLDKSQAENLCYRCRAICSHTYPGKRKIYVTCWRRGTRHLYMSTVR